MNNCPARQAARQHFVPAEPEDGHDRGETQEGDERAEQRRKPDALHGQREGLLDAVAEAADLVRLSRAKDCTTRTPPMASSRTVGRAGQLVLHRDDSPRSRRPKTIGDQHHHRNQREHKQRQAPVGDDDQDQRADEGEHLREGGGDIARSPTRARWTRRWSGG